MISSILGKSVDATCTGGRSEAVGGLGAFVSEVLAALPYYLSKIVLYLVSDFFRGLVGGEWREHRLFSIVCLSR